MKRVGAFILSLAVTLGMTAGVYAASPSSVKVSGSGTNAKTVTYQYTAGKEASKSITNLMTEVNNLSKRNKTVTQVITLTSDSSDNSPVDFKLRLVTQASLVPTPKNTPSATPDTKDSILNFYNIKVRDSGGNIVSDSKAVDDSVYVTEEGTLARDIELGILNKQSGKETKLYNVEVSINGDETTSDISKAAKQTQWQIVSGPVTEATPSPVPSASPAATSEALLEASPSAVPSSVTDAPQTTQEPQPTQETSAEETQKPEITNTPAPTPTTETYKNGGKKYVGKDKDIKPGRYTATGNGMVKVYSKDDELITSILLTDGKNGTENGIDRYVLNLTEGQRLEYTDYINLKPYVTATATPKPSSSATATPKPSSNTKNESNSSSKSNPKTGDTAPIAGISVIAVFALGMAVFMEISRRKED